MKKVFCIFAVVLILIIATVPCFAGSSGSSAGSDVSAETSSTAPVRTIYSDTSVTLTNHTSKNLTFSCRRSDDTFYSLSLPAHSSQVVTFESNTTYIFIGSLPIDLYIYSPDNTLSYTLVDYNTYFRASGSRFQVSTLVDDSSIDFFDNNNFHYTFYFQRIFSHLFDFVPNLFGSWVTASIFFFGIVFVIFMIFVIAMVIRRCRNV